MKREDFVAPPCACLECRVEKVDGKELIRDRVTGRWLHGRSLRLWYEAKERFQREARAAVGPRGRHAKGFEKLVQTEGR